MCAGLWVGGDVSRPTVGCGYLGACVQGCV